jgi:hypothetical protein
MGDLTAWPIGVYDCWVWVGHEDGPLDGGPEIRPCHLYPKPADDARSPYGWFFAVGSGEYNRDGTENPEWRPPEEYYPEVDLSYRYWVGGTGLWSDASNWGLDRYGPGGYGKPTAGMTAVIPGSLHERYITVDENVTCHAIEMGIYCSYSTDTTLDMTGRTINCEIIFTGWWHCVNHLILNGATVNTTRFVHATESTVITADANTTINIIARAEVDDEGCHGAFWGGHETYYGSVCCDFTGIKDATIQWRALSTTGEAGRPMLFGAVSADPGLSRGTLEIVPPDDYYDYELEAMVDGIAEIECEQWEVSGSISNGFLLKVNARDQYW